jgi:hypothetical protein
MFFSYFYHENQKILFSFATTIFYGGRSVKNGFHQIRLRVRKRKMCEYQNFPRPWQGVDLILIDDKKS